VNIISEEVIETKTLGSSTISLSFPPIDGKAPARDKLKTISIWKIPDI